MTRPITLICVLIVGICAGRMTAPKPVPHYPTVVSEPIVCRPGRPCGEIRRSEP